MAHGPLKKSTQINRKQHVVFFIMSMWRVHLLLCYQFGYVWFSVARKISCLKILFYTKFFFSGASCWFFWKVLRGPQKIVSRTPKGLIPWPLLELVIVRWRSNVSVQCSSRDCERFACLYNVTVARSLHFYDLPGFCLQ